MNRRRPNGVSLYSGVAQRRRRPNTTASALFLLVVVPALPAAAQTTGGGLETGSPAPATAAPAPTTGPENLPLLPQSGFGIANPLQPPYTTNPSPEAPAEPPSSVRLPPPGAGITPLQRGQPAAPPILFQPTASIGLAVTDNARNTATDRVTDLETQLMPGLSISADTPRLQGVLVGNLDYNKYIVATDEDQLFGNLYASGTATAIPDHLYLDAKSSIGQTARLGSAGFVPISQLPQSQLTQVFTSYVSPYFRESYDGLLDAELRYSFASTNFGGNTTALQPLPVIPGVPPVNSALSNSQSNTGTLILATGSNFERLLSKLTVGASQVTANVGSVIPNTQVTAYDDVEYRITPTVAALGRLGYENIQYPFVPAATTAGVVWQVGGRLGLGPGDQYVSLRYGKEEGIYGVTGSLRYEITPTTVLNASAVQGVGSQQADAQAALADSSLNSFGQMVNEYNLPTAFFNPEFALQNNVFRSYIYQAGITSSVGLNTVSLLAYYNRQISLLISEPPTRSIGANIGWTHQIRPDLSMSASLGYANTNNQSIFTNASPFSITTISTQNTVNGSLGLNYLFARNLTGSVQYSLYYQTNGATFEGSSLTGIGNVVTNRLLFLLTKTF